MPILRVYGIVKQHNGHIAVRSDESGSTFVLYLPLLEREEAGTGSEAQAVASPKTEVEPEAEAPAARSAAETQVQEKAAQERTILVVDDETPVREAVVEILRAAGFRVLEATDAEQALALQADLVPDLVLTDMVMPGMGGANFVRRIRERYPDLPVLVMSGYPRHAGGELKDLASAWLKKPFDLPTLLDQIQALL